MCKLLAKLGLFLPCVSQKISQRKTNYDLKRSHIFPKPLCGLMFTVTSPTGYALNTQNTKYAIRFQANDSLTVDKVAFYVHAVYGSPPTYRVELRTDDGTGKPSSTVKGYADFTASSAGWTTEFQLTAAEGQDLNITRGEYYHLVIRWLSGTVDASNYISIRYWNGTQMGLMSFLSATSTADPESWSLQFWTPIVAVKYTDLSYHAQPYDSFLSTGLALNIDQKKFGQRLRVPVQTTFRTALARVVTVSAAGRIVAELLDANKQVLATSAEVYIHSQGNYWYALEFPSEVTLQPDTTYYLVLRRKAGSTTNVTIGHWATKTGYEPLTFFADTWRTAWFDGTSWYEYSNGDAPVAFFLENQSAAGGGPAGAGDTQGLFRGFR